MRIFSVIRKMFRKESEVDDSAAEIEVSSIDQEGIAFPKSRPKGFGFGKGHPNYLGNKNTGQGKR
jgi:hypothetical protein